MKPFLSEDIRTILDRLDEYMIEVGEDESKKKPKSDGKADDSDKDKDAGKDDKKSSNSSDASDSTPRKTPVDRDLPVEPKDGIDRVMKKQTPIDKIVGHINTAELISHLGIPKKFQPSFRSAIERLKSVDTVPTNRENAALAVAFLRALNVLRKASHHAMPSPGVAEELDGTKIDGYMKRSQSSPNPDSDVDQMKKMIDAVKTHGTQDEKKELGINESSQQILRG
jgi:hypothetical protein